MTFECGNAFALKLCEIFGICPEGVNRLILDVQADQVACLKVYRVMTVAESRQVEELLTQMTLPVIVEKRKPRRGKPLFKEYSEDDTVTR